jgi:broad specificity phosphatase PhoE
MKRIELRRNSLREGGKGLSAYGLQLARKAKPSLAPSYDLILSSPKRRCVETVRAFGFHHYFADARLGPMDRSPLADFEKKIRKQREGDATWIEAAFAVAECRPILKQIAKEAFPALEAAWAFLPEGGRALVVTHSELIEALALLSFPTYRFSHIGRPFGPCEGIEFGFEGESAVAARPIRFEVQAEKAEAAPAEAEAEAEAPQAETAPTA